MKYVKMQQKDFLETFMVFSPCHFGPERTKIMVGIHVPPKFGTRGGKKNFESPYLPQLWTRGTEIFLTVRDLWDPHTV